MVDLSGLSDADLEALASGGSPNLSALSDSALEAIANAPNADDWTLGGSVKQGIYGAAEGALNTVGLAADLAGYLSPTTIAKTLFSPPSEQVDNLIAENPLPNDPKYRYARTTGNFLGGNAVLPGGGTTRSIFSALTGALGAQGAEDLTGDTKVAPVIGGMAAGLLPSLAVSGFRAAKGIFAGATPEQVKGSAAQILKDQGGIVPFSPLKTDSLDELATTAEVTGRAGMAQIEKTLGGKAGQFSNDYNARAIQREGARQGLLDSASATPAISPEALGSKLMDRGSDVRDQMLKEARNLWEKVPRNTKINIEAQQAGLESVLNFRQGGLDLNSKVNKLVSQVLDPENGGFKTSGSLQDIRSDVLRLKREANLSAFDDRILNTLDEGIDAAMGAGLKGNDYDLWTAARDATRSERVVFGQSGAGSALTRDTARPSNVLANAIKGDSQSIKELKTAIRNDPALIEDVKRGFIDMVPTDASGKLTTNGMKKFIQRNDGAITELLGEGHGTNLRRILEDMRSQDSVAEMAGRASAKGSVTAQKTSVAGTIRDAVLGKIVPGTGKLGSFISSLEGMAGKDSAAKIEDLLFRAAMEPEYASILASTPTDQKVQTIVEMLGNVVKETATSAAKIGAVEVVSRDQVLPEVQRARNAQSTARSIFSERSDRSGDGAAGTAPYKPPPAQQEGLSLNNASQSSTTATAQPQQVPQGGLLSLGQPNQSQLNQSGQGSESFLNDNPTPTATQDPFSTAINQIKSTTKADMSKENPTKFEARLIKSGVDIDQLDALDLAQIKAESSGVAAIEGPKTKYGTAKGLMQLLDSTGKEWHGKLGLEGKYDPFDPYQNITIGKAYREFLVDRYDGDTRLGLAAFNWGLGNLDKLINRSKTGSYEEIRSKLPAETRNYVDKIMKEANGGMVTA